MKTDRGQLLLERITRAQDHGPDPTAQQQAVDYYLGRPRGDELAGQPRIQSTDVADMIHAVQAQLLPSFCSDAVCEFEPDGPDDEAQSRLESDAVNRTIMEDGRGYIVLGAAIKDALLLKNGIIKAWVEDETVTATRRLEGVTPEALALLNAEADPERDTIEPGDDGTATLTMSTVRRRLRLEPVDPLNFVVDADHGSVLLHGTALAAERWSTTRGELLELGYSPTMVKLIPAGNPSLSSQTAQEIRNRAGEQQTDSQYEAERVYCWRCYETGPDGAIAYSLLGGDQLLETEPAPYIPYATGSALPEPHGFWGLSLFDRLKAVQDAKVLGLRQWVANLAAGNLSRTAVNDNVVIDDLTNGRPSGVVRVEGTGPVGDSIMPLPVLDMGGNAAQFMQYMDQIRADRGGAALQMAGGEAQLAGAQVGSMGVDRMFSVQEQLAAMMARNLAETLLRSLFGLVHRMLAEEYGRPMELRLAGEWQTVDPSRWRPRTRINVKQGLSQGERQRKIAGLQANVGLQLQALQAGLDGVLVDLPSIHRALLDLGHAWALDGVPGYWVDPASKAAQAAGQQKQQQAQQLQAAQLQIEQAKAQMEQAKAETDRLRAQLEAQKHRDDIAFKYRELELNAEIEEAKLSASITSDLIASQQAARNAADAAAGNAGAGGGSGG